MMTRRTTRRRFLALAAAAVASGAAAMRIPAALAAQDDLSEGEIRKVDKTRQTLTIRHGEIRNLDMPGMTMVFQVRDAAILDRVKPGDKVRFRAEKDDKTGGLVVTELQPAAR